MVVVIAHITVAVGCEAAFESAAGALAAATLEREPGIRRYEYVRLAEPSTYQATLAFEDHDAFIEHQASEHHHVLAGAMRELIVELRLERVSPVPGCWPSEPDGGVPPAPDPVGGPPIEAVSSDTLDARREHYRRRYPLDAQPWWGGIG